MHVFCNGSGGAGLKKAVLYGVSGNYLKILDS